MHEKRARIVTSSKVVKKFSDFHSVKKKCIEKINIEYQIVYEHVTSHFERLCSPD